MKIRDMVFGRRVVLLTDGRGSQGRGKAVIGTIRKRANRAGTTKQAEFSNNEETLMTSVTLDK